MRIVYVRSLAYVGSAEVIGVRRDGRLLVETPTGRMLRVRPADCCEARTTPRAVPISRVPIYDGGELAAQPKPAAPPRVPAYLAWLRRQPCARCGVEGRTEASHHPARGHGAMARKCSDMRAIALCVECHRRHHARPLERDWVEAEITAHARRWRPA